MYDEISDLGWYSLPRLSIISDRTTLQTCTDQVLWRTPNSAKRPKWPINKIGSTRDCRTFIAKNNSHHHLYIIISWEYQFIRLYRLLLSQAELFYIERNWAFLFIMCFIYIIKSCGMDSASADGKLLGGKRVVSNTWNFMSWSGKSQWILFRQECGHPGKCSAADIQKSTERSIFSVLLSLITDVWCLMVLAHLSPDKIAVFLTTLSNSFSWTKIVCFESNVTEICFYGSIL